MRKQTLYLALTCVGAVVPMSAFIPWVVVHGLDVRLMVAELFANRISTFFALDLLITACVVAIFARLESGHVKWCWIPMLVMLLVGVSAGLPLLLFLRERGQQGEASGEATLAG